MLLGISTNPPLGMPVGAPGGLRFTLSAPHSYLGVGRPMLLASSTHTHIQPHRTMLIYQLTASPAPLKCQLPEAEGSSLLSVAMTTNNKNVYSGLYFHVTLPHQKMSGQEIKHELVQKLWKSGRHAAL